MCGIAGAVGGDAARVGPMLARMGHRGPDGRTHGPGGTAWLGCVRLAIRGGSTSDQPYRTAKGWLVFNGEIYNTGELKKELAWHGVAVSGDGDTEVVGALLDLLGIRAAVDKLNGMFAIGYDDGEAVWLARDPAGIKPLYYTAKGDAFASEIGPLLGDDAAPHGPALARWLTFHYATGTETMFRGVHRVPPGGIVELPSGRVVREADPVLRFGAPNPGINAERVGKILRRSVEDAIPGEPFGVALSGGVDSTLVAALAAAQARERMTAYHGHVEEPGCDESSYARAAATELGLALVEVPITAKRCLDVLPRVLGHLEEPVAGPGSLAQFLVAERAGQDVRVLLGGCGGDELFFGYARNAAMVCDRPPAGLENYAPLFSRLQVRTAASRAFASLDRRAPALFTRDFLAAHPAPEEEFIAAFEEGGLDPVSAAARAETQVTLPALLQVEDRVTAAFAIEGRVPLLDRRLLRTATRLSTAQRFDGRLKPLLRDAAEPILPEVVRARTDKMGFPLPLGDWLKGPWRGWALDLIHDRRTAERGVLDIPAAEASLDSPGRYDRGLYAALMLELWYRARFDDRTTSSRNP